MKKILITGSNSYIGNSLERWLIQYSDKYVIDKISLREEGWRSVSFKEYDVIFHVAAIVHIKENDIDKYFEINRDLAIEVANKAEQDGVEQFIFLSTMGVYGVETGTITNSTVPNPSTSYAKSKYEAEQLLLEINSNEFHVTILRPPIVYGQGCPGNYSKLAKIALKSPIFPSIKNERSMIYIDNLSEFIRIAIDNKLSGLFFPQNKDYVDTAELVKCVAESHNKKMKTLKIFNRAVYLALKKSKTLRKVFGSFTYDKAMLGSPNTIINGKNINYETVTFEQSIKRTEGIE